MSGGGYDDTEIRQKYDELRRANITRANENVGDLRRHRQQQTAIGALDTTTKRQRTQIDRLFDRSRDAFSNIDKLRGFNKDRISEIEGLETGLTGLRDDFSDLEALVNKPTTIGEVDGLDDYLDKLQKRYTDADRDIKDLRGDTKQDLKNLRGSLTDQLKTKIADLGINQYMKTSTFNERMDDRLGTLKDTLRGEFGKEIKSLDLPGIQDAIDKAGGDLSKLSTDFAGLSKDVDWIKDLDLGSFDARLAEQGTTLENRFTDILGDRTKNLEKLISQSEGRLQADLTDATTERERLFSGLDEQSRARQKLAKQLERQGYSIEDLSTQLLGYGDRLTDYQKQFQDDLTDLRGVVGTERELALGKLEREIGQDRLADLIELREGIKGERLSDIEKMAGNLRQEYGEDLFDLSTTFDKGQEENRLAREALGADIQDLFGRSLEQDTAVAGLTTNVGTLGQNLESLQTAFGDHQLDAATNLGDVERALSGEIGDLRQSLTTGLADIQTDYLDKILGTERVGVEAREGLRKDLTGALSLEAEARQSGLATEAQARKSGLAKAASEREALAGTLRGEAESALSDVYKTREQRISELSGTFGANLRAQEERLGKRIDASTKDVDAQIGRLGSMMNYRMLGDSAGGVKMRRSKAYKSGAVSTGTGQLSRSMKLKTLNI